MDRAAIDNRIHTITQKIDENKEPFTYVMIGGIIVATVSFFVLLFMILRLIFGIGVGIVGSLKPTFEANVSNSSRATVVAPKFKIAPSSDSRTKGATTRGVYARPVGTDNREGDEDFDTEIDN